MSVAKVDAFIYRYATPALLAAGYRRQRRKYMIDGPRGRRALIQFDAEVDAYRASFELSYGVFTPAHEQFREDTGLPPKLWPSTSYALLRGKLFSPEVARSGVPVPGHVSPEMWVLGGGDDDRNAEVGAALVAAIEAEVLPQIDRWFEPEGMIRTLEHPPLTAFAGLAPIQRAVAMALLDVEGSDERLTRSLTLLPRDDMVRQWIENRTAGDPTRRTASGPQQNQP